MQKKDIKNAKNHRTPQKEEVRDIPERVSSSSNHPVEQVCKQISVLEPTIIDIAPISPLYVRSPPPTE